MKKIVFLLSCLVSLPEFASACAVCFSGADGNLIKGFTWGVAFLAVLPFVLMIALTSLIVYSIKKNKTHE